MTIARNSQQYIDFGQCTSAVMSITGLKQNARHTRKKINENFITRMHPYLHFLNFLCSVILFPPVIVFCNNSVKEIIGK